jgi:hypothetical protein
MHSKGYAENIIAYIAMTHLTKSYTDYSDEVIMALDNNNFCNDERCERTKRSKKHTVHDVADCHDRRAESIKNLLSLALICASLKNGRPQYDRDISLDQATM